LAKSDGADPRAGCHPRVVTPSVSHNLWRIRVMLRHNPRIMNRCHYFTALLCGTILLLMAGGPAHAQKLKPVDVEGQPLASNVRRVLKALEYLGTPLATEHVK